MKILKKLKLVRREPHENTAVRLALETCERCERPCPQPAINEEWVCVSCASMIGKKYRWRKEVIVNIDCKQRKKSKMIWILYSFIAGITFISALSLPTSVLDSLVLGVMWPVFWAVKLTNKLLD